MFGAFLAHGVKPSKAALIALSARGDAEMQPLGFGLDRFG